jgi:hypothetical protein
MDECISKCNNSLLSFDLFLQCSYSMRTLGGSKFFFSDMKFFSSNCI